MTSGEYGEVTSSLSFFVSKVPFVGFKAEAKTAFGDAAPNLVCSVVVFCPYASVPFGLVHIGHDVEDAGVVIVTDGCKLRGDEAVRWQPRMDDLLSSVFV
jgi:hypothetical protein